MADLLNTGLSGLLAFQRSLATISHNVANANTDGYTRQRVELGTNPPQFIGGSFIGSGAQVEGITRVYDQFLTTQVRNTTSVHSQQVALHDLAAQVDNMLADPKAGLSPALQDFFNGMDDLANDPSSQPARQLVLSGAETLTSRFNEFARRFGDLRDGINTQVTDLVGEINNLATSIAEVNHTIVNTPRGSTNQAPNDLLDRRDQLVQQLSDYTSLTTVAQSDGSLNVFIGNGQALVVGDQTQQLSTLRNPYDPTRLQVGYDAGAAAVDITGQLSGGKLGGALEFRDQVLDPAYNALGRVAIGLAETFNAQHRLGQDLQGNLGGDFFSIGSPEVLPRSSNSGTGALSIGYNDVSALTTSDYRLDRNGASYTLTRLSDNQVTDVGALGFPGAGVVVDGLSLSLSSGTIADGDSYLIRPTRPGAAGIDVAVSDPSLIAAAAPIRTSAAVDGNGLPTNTGSGKISAGTVNPPPPPDANLQQAVTITFNNPPTTFDVSGTGTGNPTNVPYTAGADISYNGWTVQITGTPAVGDSFTVGANTDGVGDNQNALLLSSLRTATTLDGATATYQDAYGRLVADVGTKTRQSDLTREAQSILLQQSQAARDAVSGVNLDEEAANMLRFQQAYQAAAQVISVANTLFDAVLGAVRR